ncbi:hypothetical protein F5880DRAFT_1589623 [Lentinula raphanica]|nr:hypothetical protein F5880DRAFT_1589623 [Lentinula raphanica]
MQRRQSGVVSHYPQYGFSCLFAVMLGLLFLAPAAAAPTQRPGFNGLVLLPNEVVEPVAQATWTVKFNVLRWGDSDTYVDDQIAAAISPWMEMALQDAIARNIPDEIVVSDYVWKKDGTHRLDVVTQAHKDDLKILQESEVLRDLRRQLKLKDPEPKYIESSALLQLLWASRDRSLKSYGGVTYIEVEGMHLLDISFSFPEPNILDKNHKLDFDFEWRVHLNPPQAAFDEAIERHKKKEEEEKKKKTGKEEETKLEVRNHVGSSVVEV